MLRTKRGIRKVGIMLIAIYYFAGTGGLSLNARDSLHKSHKDSRIEWQRQKLQSMLIRSGASPEKAASEVSSLQDVDIYEIFAVLKIRKK